MRIITVTCDSCKKDSYVQIDEFPLYCPFCGSRSDIYYKAEEGDLTLDSVKTDFL